jgi:hypothetical protein
MCEVYVTVMQEFQVHCKDLARESQQEFFMPSQAAVPAAVRMFIPGPGSIARLLPENLQSCCNIGYLRIQEALWLSAPSPHIHNR